LGGPVISDDGGLEEFTEFFPAGLSLHWALLPAALTCLFLFAVPHCELKDANFVPKGSNSQIPPTFYVSRQAHTLRGNQLHGGLYAKVQRKRESMAG
jgi:hypothetical protein